MSYIYHARGPEMKPMFLYSIVLVAAIVVASSFGLQFAPSDVAVIPDAYIGRELYVCPAASSAWDMAAATIRPFSHYIMFLFFFVMMLLMFGWGWAMYQNLLKDKFDQGSFSKTWKLTKVTFWAGVIILLVASTPNYFRTVHIRGADGDWVVCDRDTPGRRAVLAENVIP